MVVPSWLRHRSLLVTVLGAGLAGTSCGSLHETFTPERPATREPSAALDQPPPLHTGGLDVLTVDAESGRQGPDGSPTGHGDPTAEAIATGVGIMAIGTTATTTAIACSQPYSSAECLRGPGPADNEKAKPIEPVESGPILPLASPR